MRKTFANSFLDCKRIIVTDNFFTSSQLGKKLYNRNSFLLGTVRKNRSGNPKDFIREPLQVGKVQFAFRQNETLLKYQAKQTKQVCLCFTAHHYRHTQPSGKPKIITDYNQTKFAVDIFEMISRYSYRPAVKRWPLRLFMNFIVDGGNFPNLAIIAKMCFGVMGSNTPSERAFKELRVIFGNCARTRLHPLTTATLIHLRQLYKQKIAQYFAK